jgi:hypothetical protein
MSSVAFDMIAGFFDVVGTSLGKKAKSVLVTLAGASGTTLDETKGEVAQNQQAWNAGTLAVLANPLDPAKSPSGTPLKAGVVGLRTADGVIPVGWKDPRIDAAFPNGLAKGTVAFAGYGKGFHTISLVDPTDPNSTGIHTIYAPYEFDGNGVPTKAHAIVLDTTGGNSSLQLVHGDGYFFSAKAGFGWTMAVDGSTALSMEPGSGPGVAGKVTIAANVIVGGSLIIGNPATAVPLLAGPASPPCPYLFVSPV